LPAPLYKSDGRPAIITINAALQFKAKVINSDEVDQRSNTALSLE
jgi:hypothetical protein